MQNNRSCENCGNWKCSTNVLATNYDECIRTNYQKHWKPQPECDMADLVGERENVEDLKRQAHGMSLVRKYCLDCATGLYNCNISVWDCQKAKE